MIVGLQNSGKTTFATLFSPKDKRFATESFNYFEHPLTMNTTFEIWDLSGKHPHLWTHHFKNSDGFVFVIDQIKADKDDEYLEQAVKVSRQPSFPTVLL